MAERIYGLLKEFEQFLDGGVHLTMVNKVVLDERKLYEFLGALEEVLPGEIRQAKTLLNARQDILRKANEEAQRRHEALPSALQDVSIHSADRERANRMLQDARREALFIRQEADAYVEKSLLRLSKMLTSMNQEVKNGLEYIGSTEVHGREAM